MSFEVLEINYQSPRSILVRIQGQSQAQSYNDLKKTEKPTWTRIGVPCEKIYFVGGTRIIYNLSQS